jgi:hypothetical protein
VLNCHLGGEAGRSVAMISCEPTFTQKTFRSTLFFRVVLVIGFSAASTTLYSQTTVWDAATSTTCYKYYPEQKTGYYQCFGCMINEVFCTVTSDINQMDEEIIFLAEFYDNFEFSGSLGVTFLVDEDQRMWHKKFGKISEEEFSDILQSLRVDIEITYSNVEDFVAKVNQELKDYKFVWDRKYNALLFQKQGITEDPDWPLNWEINDPQSFDRVLGDFVISEKIDDKDYSDYRGNGREVFLRIARENHDEWAKLTDMKEKDSIYRAQETAQFFDIPDFNLNRNRINHPLKSRRMTDEFYDEQIRIGNYYRDPVTGVARPTDPTEPFVILISD